MTPPRSLDAVRSDDLMLDRLAARLGAEPLDDPVAHLLAALAEDVDDELPSRVDHLAVAALTAAVTNRTHARDIASGPVPVAVVRELPRRRRVVAVRRGGAVVAGLALVLGSAGVAAAVTGDPAGAFGLRALSAVVGHGSHRHATSVPSAASSRASASAAATDRLRSRIEAVARRLPAVAPAEVQALEDEARRLPDGGGPAVQEALARLRAQVGPTAGQGAGGLGSASAEKSHGAGDSASGGRGHHAPDSGHPTRGSGSPSAGSHGKEAKPKGSPSASATSASKVSPPVTSSGSQGPAKGQGDGDGQGDGVGADQGAGKSQGVRQSQGGDQGGSAGLAQGSAPGSTAVRPG